MCIQKEKKLAVLPADDGGQRKGERNGGITAKCDFNITPRITKFKREFSYP